MKRRIGFAGTDGRTLLSAISVSEDKSRTGSDDDFHGVVIRGTPAMPEFAKIMNWPITFIPTESTSVSSYADAVIAAFKNGTVRRVVPMPEDLQLHGIVNLVEEAGFGDRIAGFRKEASMLVEGDKIACKRVCREYHIPVADEWHEVEARNYSEVLRITLRLIDKYGGAVFKYPYSAAGKGSRVILNAWQTRKVYDALMADYGVKTKDGKDYATVCGNGPWPLLVESWMSGVEISFVAHVDSNAHFQIWPTAMDYPERFSGRPASTDNPITGGMGSISPHPMESKELIEMAATQIIAPFVRALKEKNILRPCLLYPNCFATVDSEMRPIRIRMSEMNMRAPEPEEQPLLRRSRNTGQIVEAMFEGNLHEIVPDVRYDNISMTMALVTGPGGPDGQKGYPWSYTKGEKVEIDFKYFDKKGIQLIPSGMDFDAATNTFRSDGTRVIYLNANGVIKAGETMADVARRLCAKLLLAVDNGKIRVVPREDPNGNRLDLRRDIGDHYWLAEITFLDIVKKLKSALGRNVKIIHSADKRVASGILTDFDESQFEVEINHNVRIGTQVIRSVVILP